MKLSNTFEEALAYAATLHRDQKRKGSQIPYVAHLMAVSAIALEHGADEEEAIAALLHDAIEDQGGNDTRQEIKHRFGNRVVEIVDGCTDAETIPKPPWRERKAAYLEHLQHAPASVCLVSAADKLHNIRAILQDYRKIGEDLWDRFNGGKAGTLWYYQSLVSIFNKVGPPDLAGEIERTLSELNQLIQKQNSQDTHAG